MKEKRLFRWVGSAFLVVVLVSLSLMAACAAPPPTVTPTPEDPLAGMKPTIWRYQSCNIVDSTDCIGVRLLKEEIEEKTNGLLKIEIYPLGGLGYPLPKIISCTRDGLLDLGECIGSFVHGEYYISDIGEQWGLVPWNLDAHRVAGAAIRPFFDKTLPSQYNQYFLRGLYGDPMCVFTNKKIETLDDLKGLKLRAKGPYMHELVTALGASPVSMSPFEIYETVSKGIIDGAITSPCFIYDNKIYEVLKYVFHVETGFTHVYHTVNKDSFDALPPVVQGWVMELSERGGKIQQDEGWENVITKTQGLVDNGMEVTHITPEDIEKIRELGQPLIDEYIEGGGLLAKEAMNALTTAVAEWEAKQ